MLVLTRKPQETIIVDGRIEIRVIRVQGNKIRLGIEAPPEVSIRRGEISPLDADTAPADAGVGAIAAVLAK